MFRLTVCLAVLTYCGIVAADGTVDLGPALRPDGPAPAEDHAQARPEPEAGMPRARRDAAEGYPELTWPIASPVNTDHFVSNYLDHDPTSAIVDHDGMPHAYDGHEGTDMSTVSLRYMDRGIEIVAAAPGTVRRVVYDQYDRNLSWDGDQRWNAVYVRHDDESEAWYGHLRTSSVVVKEGESVERGQLLGLMGSSGRSTTPHLHLEVGRIVSGSWQHRGPWQGSHCTQESLWGNQLPHAADGGFRCLGVFVTTREAVGGDVNALAIDSLKQHPLEPAVVGIDEPYLVFWLRYQCPDGGDYSYEIRRPDGSVWSSNDYILDGHRKGHYRYSWRTWSSRVTAADYGTWTLDIATGGTVVRSTTFEVGPTTVYLPRFRPINGRSLRIGGSVLRDTLRVDPRCPSVTFSLGDTPSCVSLTDDSVVTIATTPEVAGRSTYFQAYATDGEGRKDTMWYHLVDPSKPHTIAVSAAQPGAGRRGERPGAAGAVLTVRHGALHVRTSMGESILLWDLRGRRVTDARPRRAARLSGPR